jgi:hypothetical protein
MHVLNPEDLENGHDAEIKIAVRDENLFSLVNEIPAKRNDTLLKKDKIKYDDTFTDLVDDIKKQTLNTTELKFMSLLHEGISKIINERYH